MTKKLTNPQVGANGSQLGFGHLPANSPDISPRVSVLVIGAADRAEMSAVPAWLQTVGDRADVRREDHLPHALDIAPDLVVVAQSWPDEFSSSEVSAAFGRWPLAQWVVCFGAWCESDGRTRTIWPIGLRVPSRAAASRLNHVWDIVTGRRIEPLPITASRDEAFEFDLSPAFDHRLPTSAFVSSPDPAIRNWLEAFAKSNGTTDTVAFADELPDRGFVLWDVDPDVDQAARQIERFRQQRPDVRIMAVIGLSHPENIDRLRIAGADHVITKAYAISDLTTICYEPRIA